MPSELRVDKVSSTTSPYDPVFSTTGGALSHRNIIDNGAMQVAQRGTSSSANTVYINVDRFKRVASNNGTVTSQQVDDAPVGFKKSHKVTITSADTSIAAAQYEFVEHTIEGQNTIPLALGTSSAKQITLSFYVKSSLAGIFGGVIKNGAQNRSYPYQYTVNSANTWERKTITLTGDTSGTWATDNTAGLKVQWSFGAGTDYHATANAWGAGNKVTPNVARSGATSGTDGALLANVNATWQITGVQLELGSVATPFEHRSYADELQRCMRYYCQLGSIIGTGYQNGSTQLIVPLGDAGVQNASLNSGAIAMGSVPFRTTPTISGTLGTASFANHSGNAEFTSNTLSTIQASTTGTMTLTASATFNTNGQNDNSSMTCYYNGKTIDVSAEL